MTISQSKRAAGVFFTVKLLNQPSMRCEILAVGLSATNASENSLGFVNLFPYSLGRGI